MDIWYTSQPPGDGGLPDEFTPAVLDDAGITLDEGVQVTDYVTVITGRPSTLDDLWQFCLTDADGNWVTYGERTTVQDFGNAEGDTCSFTGESHSSPPSFDVRGLVVQISNTRDAQGDDDESSLLVWGEGDTWGSNPKLRPVVEQALPDGWTVSRVDQRGYTAHQYCLTAPTGEWYYVHDSHVEEYNDTGTCRLDPDMKSSG